MFLYMTSVVGVLNVEFALKLRIYRSLSLPSNLLSQIFKKFNMSQMNPKDVFHNTAYSVQLPYIAGHSLKVFNIFLFLYNDTGSISKLESGLLDLFLLGQDECKGL